MNLDKISEFQLRGSSLSEWVKQPELFWQPLLLIGLAGIAYLISKGLKKKFPEALPGWRCWLRENPFFILCFGLVSLTTAVTWGLGISAVLIKDAWVLLGLWLGISFLGSYLRDRIVTNALSVLIFLISAFFVLAGIEGTISFLNNFTLDIISPNLTALQVLQGIFVLVIALWMSLVLSRWLGERIENIKTLNPSLRVLLAKILRITFITAAFLIPISSIGLDLTVFAFLGGGIGIGIGFGLQKVISNLISGFILLADESIKPGDVIQIGTDYAGLPQGGIYGWINKLGARYTSVITRDGTEHLIPNEDLITQPVINWSFSHERVRLHVLFYIAYTADVHKAIDLVNEAAGTVDRVLDDPKPKCYLFDFSDSSIVLESRFWIKDPSEGVNKVKCAVRLKSWELFKEHGIHIPYPQRDLHIKQPAELAVTLKRAQMGGASDLDASNPAPPPPS